MADGTRRRRDGALSVAGAVALGAVSASLTGPAAAAAEFPSWSEVQRAKSNRSSAEAEITRITTLLGDLQDRADAAGRSAAIAAEAFHRAKLAEDTARGRHAVLARSADLAAAAARTSRMRAGLLAASVARGGGGTDAQLLLDAGGATDFLQRLATVTQLSGQARTITQRALSDENQATALGAQADAAADALADRATAAQQALDAGHRAVAAAATAVSAEQQHADRLVAQLAELRGTSTRLAAQYAAAARAERAELTARGAAAISAAATGRGTTSTEQAAARPTGAPAAAPTSQDPAAEASVASSAREPNSAQAASAVASARDQVGDPYRLGGAGPSEWDCSGLTMQAYASVGIDIGGHSATAQYDLAREEGKLVPYSHVRVGDLVFFTDGGAVTYHVAVYSGSGMMIEAPYPGVPVREVPVRSADRMSQVARPTTA